LLPLPPAGMAPGAASLLARLQCACEELRLERVCEASCSALRHAEGAFSLDLQVDIEHVSLKSLQAVTKALERARAGALAEVAAATLGEELWAWLAGLARGRRKKSASAPTRLQALLALLGQCMGGGAGELAGAAAASYLALLAAEGSERQWSSVFQPAIFQQVLRATRSLRRQGSLQVSREEGAAIAEENCADGQEASAVGIPRAEAVELLGRLVAFLGGHGLGASEAAFLALDELAALLLRPSDETVARLAATGLAALAARAGSPDEVRRVATAALRAALPAVLMTQESLVSIHGSIPRPLQLARSGAVAFVCGLIREHPELLTPRRCRPSSHPEEEAREPRRRKRGRDATNDESEEEEVEKESAELEEAAGTGDDTIGRCEDKEVVASPEGGDKPRVRRRRPRGQGMDDPIVTMLELMCILVPDRSEWRGFAIDSIVAVVSEAADAERRLALVSVAASDGPGRRRERAKESSQCQAMDLDGDGFCPALPLAEGQTSGVLVVADASGPTPEALTAAERFLAFLALILESERNAVRTLATELAVALLGRSGRLARSGSEAARAELVKRLLLALLRRCNDAVPTVRGRAVGGVSCALKFLAKCDDSTCLLRSIALEFQHPQYVDLAGLFKAAAKDEKPMVRRAALHLFDAVLPLLRSPLRLDENNASVFFDVNAIEGLATDESILVRRASVGSLALLLQTCPSPPICDLWVRNILPMALDVEASVTERALDELEASVLSPLAEHTDGSNKGASLPPVLDSLNSEATEYLQRGLRLLMKRNGGCMPARFVSSLLTLVRRCLRPPRPLHEWPVAVWSMLEEITSVGSVGAVEFKLILDAWLLFSAGGTDDWNTRGGREQLGLVGTKILCTLENLMPRAPQDRTEELIKSLRDALASFSAPTSMIRGMMRVIDQIEQTWKSKKLHVEKASERAAWRASFLQSIHATLNAYVLEAQIDAQALCACLFTLGELAILDKSIISEGIVTQVQTIATNTIFRGGERVDTDPAARGHAFATLGKFCLKRENLAKNSLELLVLHMRSSESFAVRNNVLIVLGDLCVQYTSLVDRFVPCMTAVFRDDNELLRKQAAMIIASLLSEDFIKFRGLTMFRFLFLLSDPADAVRGFVQCVFERILHRRNPALFSQNFLDVICAFNSWSGLSNFKGAAGNEEFTLRESPSRRTMVYRFMLALMSNEQKFSVCAQIVTTLLAAFVDAEERLELPQTVREPAGQVLSDGLALLCCQEMRICFSARQAGQDDEGEPEGGAGGEAARGVLSSILKRNMCENIVPVLVQLKNLMESQRSPFLKQLRHCLLEILRDFKDDLPAMLAGDARLAAELAFDLQITAAPGEAAALAATPALPQGSYKASRRLSLGAMINTPAQMTPLMGATSTPCDATAATPIMDASAVDDCSASALPKARRSTAVAAIAPATRQTARRKEPELPMVSGTLKSAGKDLLGTGVPPLAGRGRAKRPCRRVSADGGA